MSFSTLADYSESLPSDCLAGEERRVTTSGVAIDSTAQFSPPLVSIITIVLGNANQIERTMQSVFAQTYPNIEYIVIDGGSTDGTVDVIRRYGGKLSYWHSRRDKGISDAFNMGVTVSRGTFIGLVNADDWMQFEQVASAVACLNETGAPFVFGDLIYHYSNGEKAFLIKPETDYYRSIKYRMPRLTHPTVIARRSMYERLGLFDLNWRVAMDHEWLLRAEKNGFRGAYTSRIVGHMSLSGVSDDRWWEGMIEVRHICISHGTSWLLASGRCLFDIAKSGARRLLERLFGETAIRSVRTRINPYLRHFDP